MVDTKQMSKPEKIDKDKFDFMSKPKPQPQPEVVATNKPKKAKADKDANGKGGYTRLTVNIPDDMHIRLKVEAAKTKGVTITKLIIEAIEAKHK